MKVEIVYRQLNKYGEELCGDRIEVQSNGENKYFVLSDGLGSGVKANILSSLTTKIIATMLREGCSMYEVAETLNKTLPICKERKIAYSTFTALKINSSGDVESSEYDNPELLWFSEGKPKYIPRTKAKYSKKMIVSESKFKLKEGDMLVAISDGIIHAGIGKTWDLGWSLERVTQFVKSILVIKKSATEVCEEVIRVVNNLYAGEPGDDASVAVIHYRKKNEIIIMIGPPKDREKDKYVIEKLLSFRGKKIVCGGTTGSLVANYMGEEIEVLINTGTDDIPPMGKLKNIDLLTEGILTFSTVVDMFRDGVPIDKIKYKIDGASKLYKEIYFADTVHFLLGEAINKAHQSIMTPLRLGLKYQLVKELEAILKSLGKEVIIERF